MRARRSPHHEPSQPLMTIHSFRLCHSNTVPDNDSRSFTLDSKVPLTNHTLFVIKKHQQLYIYQNRCPHLGIELEWQPHQFLDSAHEYIQCHTHGALFEIDSGHCIVGPCAGKALTPIAFTLSPEGYIDVSIELTSPNDRDIK